MKIKITAIILAAVCVQMSASAAGARYAPPASPRAVYSFNPGWAWHGILLATARPVFGLAAGSSSLGPGSWVGRCAIWLSSGIRLSLGSHWVT